jgi:hypothetical protein
MRLQDVLADQANYAHRIMEMAVGDCPDEIWRAQLPNAKIVSASSVYAHTVFSEDGILNGMVRGTTPVYYADGWADKIGVKMPQGSIEDGWDPQYDLATFREYAQSVYKASSAYIESASDEELERMVDTGFAGVQPVRSIFGNILLWHAATHQGEISALKGVQGIHGLVMTSH